MCLNLLYARIGRDRWVHCFELSLPYGSRYPMGVGKQLLLALHVVKILACEQAFRRPHYICIKGFRGRGGGGGVHTLLNAAGPF